MKGIDRPSAQEKILSFYINVAVFGCELMTGIDANCFLVILDIFLKCRGIVPACPLSPLFWPNLTTGTLAHLIECPFRFV